MVATCICSPGLLVRVEDQAASGLMQRDGSLNCVEGVLHLFLGVIERKVDRHRDAHPANDLKQLVFEVGPKAQRTFRRV